MLETGAIRQIHLAKQQTVQRQFSSDSSARRSLTLFWSIFKLAIWNLQANKLRTFLTLLGVIVGVAAVISVVTIIRGLDNYVAQTFSSQGSTVFTVSRLPTVITSREEMLKVNKRKDITREDAEAIRRQCVDCWRVGYWMRGSEQVKYGNSASDDVTIRGATLSMFEIDNLTVEAGRIWTEAEGNAGQYVAVVGADILKNVLSDAPPEQAIGKEIRVRGVVFRVIGTIQPMGKILGASRDNFVYIPYQTALKLLPERGSLAVNIQVRNAADLENAEDQARTIMRTRRGQTALAEGEDEGFTVESSDVFLSIYQDATANIYLVTLGVSAISLVVGGIVVMNIMLVSVAERTKEIGLRKAVGARGRDVLTQFLIEAVTLTTIGGAIGVFAGFGLALLISLFVGFPALVSVWSIVLGVGTSSIVGIASGLYPAWRAANLNPVEAMRKE